METIFSKEQNLSWMNRLTRTIEQNLENPKLTNAHLAKMIGMSERSFYRRIELLTGKSPNHYIRDIRLQRAENLLKSGDYRTVKEVALRVGFLKVSYFSKLFEKHIGIRPKEILRG